MTTSGLRSGGVLRVLPGLVHRGPRMFRLSCNMVSVASWIVGRILTTTRESRLLRQACRKVGCTSAGSVAGLGSRTNTAKGIGVLRETATPAVNTATPIAHVVFATSRVPPRRPTQFLPRGMDVRLSLTRRSLPSLMVETTRLTSFGTASMRMAPEYGSTDRGGRLVALRYSRGGRLMTDGRRLRMFLPVRPKPLATTTLARTTMKTGRTTSNVNGAGITTLPHHSRCLLGRRVEAAVTPVFCRCSYCRLVWVCHPPMLPPAPTRSELKYLPSTPASGSGTGGRSKEAGGIQGGHLIVTGPQRHQRVVRLPTRCRTCCTCKPTRYAAPAPRIGGGA